MRRQIFVNIPVSNLPQAMDFYTAIGFVNNPQFTDETAACMVFSEEIYLMLLTHDKFKSFINKPMADSKNTTGAIMAVSAESREAVDDTLEKAIAAGAKETGEAKDYGFMYYRSFEDLDGHNWEFLYMDEVPPPETSVEG